MRIAFRISDPKGTPRVRSGRRAVAAATLMCFATSTLSPMVALAEPLESHNVDVQSVVSDVASSTSNLGHAAVAADAAGQRQLQPGDRISGPDPSAAALDQSQLRVGTSDLAVSSGGGTAPPTSDTLALPTGADKSGVTSQAISIPQGAGKIDGMGESFSTQLSTGVATFSVPFVLPGARGTAQPSLSLSYSSGGGAGLAGIGWSFGVPFIGRQTDRGVPRYRDRSGFQPDQDRFVFNGGQELVPICIVGIELDCAGGLDGEVMPPWSAGSMYFRARVEGSFMRFFWAPNHLTWRVQDKGGVTMELGVPLDGSNDTTALERNPDQPDEVYKWHLVRQYDTYGSANPSSPSALPTPVNQVVYRYFQVGNMAYLSDIFDTSPASAPATTDTSTFAHHTRLTYEDRTDPTFSYRSGWRIDQLKRIKRIDVTSKTFNESEDSARRLVRRYHLSYESGQHASLLARIEVEGRCGQADQANPNAIVPEASAPAERGLDLPGTACPRLPPMTFGYNHVTPFTTAGEPGTADLPGYEGLDERLRQVATSPRHSLDEGLSDLFDIDSDALPDLVVTSPGTYGPDHGMFLNSAGGVADSFGPAQQMGVQGVLGASSATLKLSNLNVVPLDLDGDAKADLLHMPALKTYAVYRPELLGKKWTWVGRAIETASRQNSKIDFGKDTRETRVVDVNFDGLVDVVISTGLEFQTFFALGRYPGGDGQFGSAVQTGANSSEVSNDPIRTCVPSAGTPVRFSDHDTLLADMNGDGIQDIVRLRRGDVRYWPGRGNGVWGTGRRDNCPENTFSNDRFIAMNESPFFSDLEGKSLQIDDVNGDGLDDLVQVRFNAVDIWLNVDGLGWTDRHIIKDTPESPSFANRVRLVDVNGSGTRDILWGNSGSYQYIDLQGGTATHLLTRIENGLGKSTSIEYGTSTAEMLAAEKFGGGCSASERPWASPWCSKMPTVTHVVKRVTESDNLIVAGKPPCTYVTEYKYRDPVFDGPQREFRGFSKVRSVQVGDQNSPTDFTDTTFLLGECADETNNGIDDCAPSERWRDNPKEALKGLPFLTEKYDEHGVYVSTDIKTHRLRRLYVGLDGREVRHAFESSQRSIRYDTAAGPPASTTTIPLTAVELELTRDPAWDPFTSPDSVAATVQPDPSFPPASVPIRASTGYAIVESSSAVDYNGHELVAIARGCTDGPVCPVDDEIIYKFTKPFLPPGEETGWLWRTERSYVRGNIHTAVREDTTTSYNSHGDPLIVTAVLGGTVQLDRFRSSGSGPVAPSPPGASMDGTITTSSKTYDPVLGMLVRERAPNAGSPGAVEGCRDLGYAADAYAMLPTGETIYRNGCGNAPLSTAAVYDRGLGVVTVMVDMQGQSSFADYDSFGRVGELRTPHPSGAGAVVHPALATVKLAYFLPGPANPTNYSIIQTRTQDGPNPESSEVLEQFSYVDGLGRAVVTLSEADPSADGRDQGAWIAENFSEYDNKLALRRKYLAFFTNASPLSFPLAAPPPAPYSRQRYDAFGRQLQTFDLDGTVTLETRYHALSTDAFDAADLEPGSHQNTPASTRSDGHGRVVATTERIHVNGAVEAREMRTEYLATGEPEVMTRLRIGKNDPPVVRWMRYDTLGRLVLNVEPHTSQNFTTDTDVSATPSASGLKAWRYAYSNTGDLVGTSDARGCGVNYGYDGTGRLLTEDFSPCESSHTAYTAPNPATGDGFEVVRVYDAILSGYPGGFGEVPVGFEPTSAFLVGRLVAVFDRAQTKWLTYDGRGRIVRTDQRVTRANASASEAFSTRYAPRWYTRDFAFDANDREVASTTGSRVAELQGAPIAEFGFPVTRNRSVVTTSFTRRGTLKAVSGSFGTLIQHLDRAADGPINEISYGDAAATTTSFSYDDRRRLSNAQTYRAPPSIWSGPTYQPAPDPDSVTSFQLLLQDDQFAYDVVGNPIEIRDWRDPAEWPDGAKPVTRKVQYDDLYRATRIDYQYVSDGDTWISPFAAENSGAPTLQDPRRARPRPHVEFAQRPHSQHYGYDWLGNTLTSDDDAHGFYDRSLGAITNGAGEGKPYQLQSATNSGADGSRTGSLAALYDSTGNLTRLDVSRTGPCLPTGSECSGRFDYEWDEVGRLVRARRWDVASSSLTTPSAPLPVTAPAADLRYAYDAGDVRVLKTGVDAAGAQRHTLYVSDSLELRRAEFVGGEYALSPETEVPYLSAHGVRLARVVLEGAEDGEPRVGGARLHVFLELSDELGSIGVVIDKATGELVERSTYQAYGSSDSDYRPDRWRAFREDYRFTGKEEDVEVGLVYFGNRFYNAALNRWLSPDPLSVHSPGAADENLYAYVKGSVLRDVDPLGLENEPASKADSWDSASLPAWEEPAGTPDLGRPRSGVEGPAFQSDDRPRTVGRGIIDWMLSQDIAPGSGHPSYVMSSDAEVQAYQMWARVQQNRPPDDRLGPAKMHDFVRTYSGLGALDDGVSRIAKNPSDPYSWGRGGMDAGSGALQVAGWFSMIGRAGIAKITMEGNVVFEIPKGATPAEVASMELHCQICNEAVAAGYMSPTGRVPTTGGQLGKAIDKARKSERKAAAAAGRPYGDKVAGHGPDSTWTNNPIPYRWQPLTVKVNSSLGRQAQRYAPGFKPTWFALKKPN